MNNNRQILEAAFQVLYAQDTCPDQEEDAMNLALSIPLERTEKARGRATLHTQQKRHSLNKKIKEKAAIEGPKLDALFELETAQKPSKLLRDLVKNEEEIELLLEKLKRYLKNSQENQEFTKTLSEVKRINTQSLHALQELLTLLPNSSQKSPNLEQLKTALCEIQEIAKILRDIFSKTADTLPSILAPINKALKEQQKLAKEVTELCLLVKKHLTKTDELIKKVTTNYRIERLGSVEKIALRLGITEIQHSPKVNKAMAINGAIELARRFGSSESASFINGVLDKISE